MDMSELLKVAPEWAVLLVILVAVFSWVGRIVSEASETWANVLGPLGRRWRDRGLARQEARAAERTARMADLEDMTRQRDTLDVALKKCRESQEVVYDWIDYDARWHRDVRLRAAEAGCDLPEHQSLFRWRAEQ